MALILVVDDDPDILHLMALRLRKVGHDVAAFSDGPAALAAVAENGAPDAAVLDVSMPAMSGMELLRALRRREDCPDLPAVFLSARVLPEDIAAGEALGATYLTKPFVSTVLLRAVEQALLPESERRARLAAIMGVEVDRRGPAPLVRFSGDRRARSVAPPGF